MFLGAEYNESKFSRAVGLSAIAHSVDGTLLTTVCSTWSSALTQSHTQNLVCSPHGDQASSWV